MARQSRKNHTEETRAKPGSNAERYRLGEQDAPFEEGELNELRKVLNDGFLGVDIWPGETSETGTEDPFWEVKVKMPEHIVRVFDDFTHMALLKGLDRDEIMELWKQHVERNPDISLPSWENSNPFGFDVDGLWDVLKGACDRTLGHRSRSLRENGGDTEFSDLVREAKPFSRIWFELVILSDISKLRGCWNDLFFGRDDPKRVTARVSLFSGRIGRAVEHYRWRFVYGAHALRGKKVVDSASAGGKQRRAATRSETTERLAAMKELVNAGHTISRAAELAASKGIGSSTGANRRLWSRHKKK